MKITDCHITKMPESLFDPMPQVIVTMEDGSEFNLFSYYPDEISFQPEEFIGLTRKEALDFFHKKDVSYLQS